MAEDKQQTLSNLYSLRAGISAVANEREEVEKINSQANNKIEEINNEISKYEDQEIGSLNNEIEKMQNDNIQYTNEIKNLKDNIKQQGKLLNDGKEEFRNNDIIDAINHYDISFWSKRVKAPSSGYYGSWKSDRFLDGYKCLIPVVFAVIYLIVYFCVPLYNDNIIPFTLLVILAVLAAVFFLVGIGFLIGAISIFRELPETYKRINEDYENQLKKYKYKNSIVKDIENNLNEIKSLKQNIENNEKLIGEKRSEIEEINNKIKDCQNKIPQLEATAEKACIPHYQLGGVIQQQFENQFNSFLNLRDWANIDIIIFAYESGRVDTLREALTYADQETRTDRIVKTINDSSQAVCRSIQSGLRDLAYGMGECFSIISEQIAEQTNRLDKISINIESLSNNMENLSINTANLSINTANLATSIAENTAKSTENLANLASKVDYANALQEQRNISSAKLVEENSTFMLEARNYMHDLYNDRY